MSTCSGNAQEDVAARRVRARDDIGAFDADRGIEYGRVAPRMRMVPSTRVPSCCAASVLTVLWLPMASTMAKQILRSGMRRAIALSLVRRRSAGRSVNCIAMVML